MVEVTVRRKTGFLAGTAVDVEGAMMNVGEGKRNKTDDELQLQAVRSMPQESTTRSKWARGARERRSGRGSEMKKGGRRD